MSESDPFVLAAPQTTDGSPNGDAGGRARAVASGFRCPGWIGAAAESGGVAWRRGAESDFIVCRCRCRSGKDTQSSCAGSLDGSASCDCSAVLPLRGSPAEFRWPDGVRRTDDAAEFRGDVFVPDGTALVSEALPKRGCRKIVGRPLALSIFVAVSGADDRGCDLSCK